MDTQRAGVFRGCHIFDTHEAVFYLDESGQIVGLTSKKIRGIIGVASENEVTGAIGNPVLHALGESTSDQEIQQLLSDLNIAYGGRIERLINCS